VLTYPLTWQYYSGYVRLNSDNKVCECPTGANHYCTASQHPSQAYCAPGRICSYASTLGNNDGCGIFLVGNGHYCVATFPFVTDDLSILRILQPPSRSICFLVEYGDEVTPQSTSVCWDGQTDSSFTLPGFGAVLSLRGSYSTTVPTFQGEFVIRSRNSGWVYPSVNQQGEYSPSKCGWAQKQQLGIDPTYDPLALSAVTSISPINCGTDAMAISVSYTDFASILVKDYSAISRLNLFGTPYFSSFGPNTTMTVVPFSGPDAAFTLDMPVGGVSVDLDVACPVITNIVQSAVRQSGFAGRLDVTVASTCGKGEVTISASVIGGVGTVLASCLVVVDSPVTCSIPITGGSDIVTYNVVATSYTTSVNKSINVTTEAPLVLNGTQIVTQGADSTIFGGSKSFLGVDVSGIGSNPLTTTILTILEWVGIGLGILAVIALVVYLVYYCYTRKKAMSSVSGVAEGRTPRRPKSVKSA
jgi:hypothetical protein